MEKVQALEKAAQEILNGKMESAKDVIKTEYPFNRLASTERKYTVQVRLGVLVGEMRVAQKCDIFICASLPSAGGFYLSRRLYSH